MTLQQLEYIVAVDTYRHFSRAAEACGVTQPTLSLQVIKLEEELGLPIFDRKANPLRPTIAGELLLKQASAAVRMTRQIKETALKVLNQNQGEVFLGMSSSVAPYLLPPLVQYMRKSCPDVEIHCLESNRSELLGKLRRGEIDMAVMPDYNDASDLLAIPLYTENIIAYLPPHHPFLSMEEVPVSLLKNEHVWGYYEMRKIIADSVEEEVIINETEFENGSLFTLVALSEANGGIMVAPQTIIDVMRLERYTNLRPLVDPVPQRHIQLYIRQDYVMEQMLNVVGQAVCQVVPEPMLDEHLRKFGIRL